MIQGVENVRQCHPTAWCARAPRDGAMMHTPFLLAALEEARLGRGSCAPNPSVGAVAVKDNQIIAHAYHHGPGTLHAEPMVLSQFPAHTSGVTLYVTLEPCNHWGRTPPCVEAIIRHGIERVVYAYADPHPIIRAHDTRQWLLDHHIEVVHAPVDAIDAFYESYAYWCRTHQPWVSAKIAQSLDGKIADEHGQARQLSNALCYEFTHQQRQACDVILTSAKTIVRDDPLLNVRLPDKTQSKVLAVIDQSLTLPRDARVLQQALTTHVYHDQNKTPVSIHPRCVYHPMPLNTQGQMDLREVLSHLGHLGYHDVWVEAGGQLFSALHHLGLVHQTYIYLTPQIIGEAGVPAYHETSLFQRQHQITWQPRGDNMIMSIRWEEEKCLQD